MKPDYTICIGGEEYEKGKRAWTRIGVGWIASGGGTSGSIKIDFPAPILIDSNTKIAIFKFKEKD